MKPALLAIVTLFFLFSSVGCQIEGLRIKKAKEGVLKEDLYSLRSSIDQFTQEKGHAPESLDDLVKLGYLRAIPVDPITNSRTTWQVIYQDSNSDTQSPPAVRPQTMPKANGIIDIQSGSHEIAADGTHYSDW
jgi:general secretion pathway protein G